MTVPMHGKAASQVDSELDAREARARLQLRQAADLEQEATRELDRVYWARKERSRLPTLPLSEKRA